MVNGSSIAERWAALAGEPEGERTAAMRQILEEVLALDDAERQTTIERMVEREYALPDDQLRPFTISRLRTWLGIANGNMEGAQTLARGYDMAFDRLGASMAMRRSTIVQTIARHDLEPDEVTGLFDLIPSIVRQVPRAVSPTPTWERPAAKKPFWKFW